MTATSSQAVSVALPSGGPNPSPAFAVRLRLLVVGTLLLSLAFVPYGQFYLAYVGFVPLLLLLGGLRRQRAAFFWGWAAGTVFFAANMWWLVFVSAAGMVALSIYLGLYWGLAALVLRGCGLLIEPPGDALAPIDWRRVLKSVLLTPVVWCGFEWLRGNWSLIGHHGLPWLYAGYTQSPLLPICQIADVTGVMGITYLVLLINALVAALLGIRFLRRSGAAIESGAAVDVRAARPAAIVTAGVVAIVCVYGFWRIRQTDTTPGPTVLVIQPNYPQSNSGEKGAPLATILDFHLRTTAAALKAARQHGPVDLVAWSETMLTAVNDETIGEPQLVGTDFGNDAVQGRRQVEVFCRDEHVALLAGGNFAADWEPRGEEIFPRNRRNSAFYFGADGVLSSQRQDKLSLVPFGEFIPFKDFCPPLYQVLVHLGPSYYEDYTLVPGESIVRFRLDGADGVTHFVVPICFEDLLGNQVAQMVGGWTGKQADFIINITNDGWFRGSEMSQHFQAAIFRCIENRVPMARSVNTGISGFIDSAGRISGTVSAGTEGFSFQQLRLDGRWTVYTRVGDAFAWACAAITLVLMVIGIARLSRLGSKHSR
jgi:apolipoprotein N-acyltransferase